MLGKLLKHEWRAVWKVPTLLIGVLMLIAVVAGGTFALPIWDSEWIGLPLSGVMMIMMFYFAMIATGVGIMIYFAVRYYKNMYTDEGYLTHTLPVTARLLLLNKVITMTAWNLIAASAGSRKIRAAGTGSTSPASAGSGKIRTASPASGRSIWPESVRHAGTVAGIWPESVSPAGTGSVRAAADAGSRNASAAPASTEYGFGRSIGMDVPEAECRRSGTAAGNPEPDFSKPESDACEWTCSRTESDVWK